MLESLGFVERSRAIHGVRLYQFALPPDSPRRDAFERLTDLAGDRAGRLRLIKVLRSRDQPTPEGRQPAQDVLAKPRQLLPLAKLRPALATPPHPQHASEESGGEKWLKVI